MRSPAQHNHAPVCLFAYKRLKTLRQTVASLQANYRAAQTDLYIFSDAAPAGREQDEQQVREVREYLQQVSGFRSVSHCYADVNKGLADSIIGGVSAIVELHDRVIVLEDDLVVSSNFLDYMNQALDAYAGNQNIFSISGYSIPIRHPKGQEVYFTSRASSWGWATWKDRWQKIDWEVNDYGDFMKNSLRQKAFNRMGSDLSSMLKKQMSHKINSWAIRWTYHQFKENSFTVFPVVSKVSNEGFGDEGTHTSGSNRSRFSTSVDRSSQREFEFPDQPFLQPGIIRQFVHPYSLSVRALYKIKSILQ